MRQVGRYELLSKLGEGGMGTVWLAHDPLLKRNVAIKRILSSSGADAEMGRKRLVREAQAAAQLSHPNIVSIYDIVTGGEDTAIVMEFVEGSTLDDLIPPAEPTARDLALRVLHACAAALDHAHQRGIIHRDVKPGNVMVEKRGVVKIADFGIAKILNATSGLTRGMAIGTIEYMSPEQLNGNAVDGRADQYSLAVMAYRMLTGARIFDAQEFAVWCKKVALESPVRPSARNPALPAAVDGVFERALAKSPVERYADCAELVGELEQKLAGAPGRPAMSNAPTQRVPRGASFYLSISAIAGVAVAGASFLAVINSGYVVVSQWPYVMPAPATQRNAAEPPEAILPRLQVDQAARQPVESKGGPASSVNPPPVLDASDESGIFRDPGSYIEFRYPGKVFRKVDAVESTEVIRLKSNEGVTISVSIVAADGDGALSNAYRMELENPGRSIEYKTGARKGWYVVSGFEGSTLFYRRVVLTKGHIAAMTITHDKDLTPSFNPASVVAPTFRAIGGER